MTTNETPQPPGPPGPPAEVASRPPKPLVVGIGASVDSLASLEAFCAGLSEPLDAAFVLTLQRREAFDEERVRRILDSAGAFRAVTIRDGTRVEAGAIYLAAPDVMVTLSNGVLHTRPAEERPGERGTIDSFLLSLAEDQGEDAMAIVFQGTGSAGSLGVAAVKEGGGLTVAEPAASHADPALAAVKTAAAMADFVLPADRIPERVAIHARERVRARTAAGQAILPAIQAALARVATILRKKTGHDFHGYKHNTFLRRIQRRMQVVGAETLDAYLEALVQDEAEVQNLFDDLLIGVTRFFRDAPEFEALKAEVIPKLFDGKGRGDQLRVWVLGCATGEEAYSIAILLREHMTELDAAPEVQIFATDIDTKSLAAARIGRFSRAIQEDVTPERLARWFVKEGATYCIAREVREMCVFSAHNVTRDAPFSRLDLVSCRNLLIYFDAELQARVIPIFHFALRPTGYLFLGNSENVTHHPKLFAPIDRRSRLFRRLETVTRTVPDFPIAMGARMAGPIAPPPTSRALQAQLAQDAEAVAARYTPAYVIVDERHDVLHFSGRTGRFIDPASGAANLNVFSLIHPDLRLDLRASLQQALDTKAAARRDGLSIGQNGTRLAVDMAVEPVRPGQDGTRRFVVLFNQGATLADPQAEPRPPLSHDDHIQRLEGELSSSREHLQATVEELESTNEELKSSNEEYQSLNEELQSANEELETSKEEMQSINEELTTVNGELGQRVQELGRANSDVKNLLESTQIATIFLDNDLRVRNYTPAVTELFHLVDTDIGRSIAHIKAKIAFEELHDDVRRVMRTLGRAERELENAATGLRYLVRVLPYRSLENVIAGAVITFVEVTPLTRAEEALRESERRLRAVIEGIPQLVWRSRDGGNRTWASPQWTAYTGLTEEASRGRGWLEAVHPEDRAGALAAWGRAQESRSYSGEYRLRQASDDSYRWFKTRAVPVEDEGGAIAEWLGTSTDVQDLRELAERQSMLTAELQHRVRNTLAVIRSIARRTAENSDTAEDYAMHLDGRINAFARVQAVVTRDPTAGVDLERLVADELLAHQAKEGDQVVISGPAVRLRPKAAETIGLALHELSTNAVKHGALVRSGGGVSVRWGIAPDGDAQRLRLDWVETGAEPLTDAPRRRGFGTELLERTLRFELDAETTLDYGPTGLHCTIVLPLTDRIVLSRPPEPAPEPAEA